MAEAVPKKALSLQWQMLVGFMVGSIKAYIDGTMAPRLLGTGNVA